MSERERSGVDEALGRAADGAFVVTSDGTIVLWNRAAEKVLGYTAGDAIGRPCADLLAGRDQDGHRLCVGGCQVMMLVRPADPVRAFDMQTHTKTGRPLWLGISALVAPDGHGGTLTIHLFREVTATKELLKLVKERLAVRAGSTRPTTELTRRELQVLRLIAGGANTKTIAARLHVSPATVRNHAQNIMGKLGVHSRLQAVAYATSCRLL